MKNGKIAISTQETSTGYKKKSPNWGFPLLIHQIAFEVCKTLSHGDALFLLLHKGTETCWDIDIDAEDIVYLFLELRRMGRLAEDTDFSRL